MSKDFFEEPLEQSKVKSQIVSEYFQAWAKIILSNTQGDAAYIDLFSGPGRYKDGAESTPILVLKAVIANDNIRNRLVSIFTDKRKDHSDFLWKEVAKLPGIKTLKHPPQIAQKEVGEDIVKILNEMKLIPSLVFLDPCGYKGLSLELINSVIKDWACECIFFFNYNQINAGIHNDSVEEHINRIFSTKRANILRLALRNQPPHKREKLIMNELTDALKETYGKFVHRFCVKRRDEERTSHYLIFVTKNFLGYEIMRDIMAKYSSYKVQGVPSFEYNKFYSPDLFYKPLDELKKMLLNEFAGQTLRMYDIYRNHSAGRNYIKKNYKQALIQLADDNKIQAVSPTKRKRRKDTMGDNIKIIFPPKE